MSLFSLTNNLFSAFATSSGLLEWVARVAKRIIWEPSRGRPLRRAASLKTLLHRFLYTALPRRLGATKATFPKSPSSPNRAVTRTSLSFVRLPLEKTRSNSRLDLMVLISRLDGQALAALCTTTGQDGATILGGHTSTEAVGLCALPLVGLIRTLHFKPSWDVINVNKPQDCRGLQRGMSNTVKKYL